eukprot:gene14949-20109_t
MEELQDAIEDAQYMHAMSDNSPHPTSEWIWPKQEEIDKYVERIKESHPTALELETICEGSLGLYLFVRFLKREGNGPHGDFLMEIAHMRAQISANLSVNIKKIVNDYIIDGSIGRDEIIERSIVPKLSRRIPKDEKYNTLKFSTGDNALQLSGEIVTQLIDKYWKPVSKSKIAEETIDIFLFNALDFAVFNNLKEKFSDMFFSSAEWMKYLSFMAMVDRKLSEENDFLILRVLGRGGFGQVNACKRSTTGKLYAMKTLHKKRVKFRKSEELCIAERDILTMVDSPYIVCLKYSFQSPTDLFLILDLMMGGDLGFYLSKNSNFSSYQTKYYSARTMLGIAALHELQIVYRDLKPENILMDAEGYTKISDLGLACKITDHRGITGTCGTRGYWAPEMLRRTAEGRRERYSVCVDWFSFGVCVYEFLTGISPFRTERARNWIRQQDKAYGSVDSIKLIAKDVKDDKAAGDKDDKKGEKQDKEKGMDMAIQEMEPDYSLIKDPVAVDFLQKLLIKDPKLRLGANGYREIAAHPFYDEIDWSIFNTIKPPIQPQKDINTATQSEIGGFADVKELKKIKLEETDHAVYKNWDFIAINSYQEEIVEFLCHEEVLGPIKPDMVADKCCVIS